MTHMSYLALGNLILSVALYKRRRPLRKNPLLPSPVMGNLY